MQKVLNIFRAWLPIAVVVIGMCALVYVAVQQDLRQGANDPQIQMAEDAAAALAQGQGVDALVLSAKVDIASSLAAFLIIYDDSGKVLASSALLHGGTPALPAGVLDYVRQHGQDRISWQPEPGVRMAAVITHYTGTNAGFVLAGRSLREVEKREANTEQIAGFVMLLALAASFVAIAFGEFFLRGKKSS